MTESQCRNSTAADEAESNHHCGPPSATLLRYLYRANGQKLGAEAVFAGAPTAELVERLRECLQDGRFVPEQVGLPGRYPWLCDICPATESDPGWHEVETVESSILPPSEPRTFEQFVDEVEAAATRGWKPVDPFEHQSRHLPEVVENLRESLSRWRKRTRRLGHEPHPEAENALVAPWDDSTWLSMNERYPQLALGCARSGVWPSSVAWDDWRIDWEDLFQKLLNEDPVLAAMFLVRAPVEALREIELQNIEPPDESDASTLRSSVQAARCRRQIAEDDGHDDQALVGVFNWESVPAEVVPKCDNLAFSVVELTTSGLDELLAQVEQFREGHKVADGPNGEYRRLGSHPGIRIRLISGDSLGENLREDLMGHEQAASFSAINNDCAPYVTVGPNVMDRLSDAGPVLSTTFHTNGSYVGWSEPLFTEPDPLKRPTECNLPYPTFVPPVPFGALLMLRMLTAGNHRCGTLFQRFAEVAPAVAVRLLKGEAIDTVVGDYTRTVSPMLSTEHLTPLLASDNEETRRKAIRRLAGMKESGVHHSDLGDATDGNGPAPASPTTQDR